MGIEGQGESGCFKVSLKILNLHILGLHFSVELLNLNVSVTGKGSLIYQSKKKPLIANFSIRIPNPCFKTTKTTKQVKNKCT